MIIHVRPASGAGHDEEQGQMVDFTKKIQKHGEGFEAGEQIITAGVVTPRGQVMRNAVAGGIGGLLGQGIAAAADKRRASKDAKTAEGAAGVVGGLAEGFPTAKVFLTVTDRRVVLHEFGTMSGKPKGVVGSYPRDQIAGFEVAGGKLVSQMTLRFADGSAVALDLMKGGGAPQRFVAATGGPQPSADV